VTLDMLMLASTMLRMEKRYFIRELSLGAKVKNFPFTLGA